MPFMNTWQTVDSDRRKRENRCSPQIFISSPREKICSEPENSNNPKDFRSSYIQVPKRLSDAEVKLVERQEVGHLADHHNHHGDSRLAVGAHVSGWSVGRTAVGHHFG